MAPAKKIAAKPAKRAVKKTAAKRSTKKAQAKKATPAVEVSPALKPVDMSGLRGVSQDDLNPAYAGPRE